MRDSTGTRKNCGVYREKLQGASKSTHLLHEQMAVTAVCVAVLSGEARGRGEGGSGRARRLCYFECELAVMWAGAVVEEGVEFVAGC